MLIIIGVVNYQTNNSSFMMHYLVFCLAGCVLL